MASLKLKINLIIVIVVTFILGSAGVYETSRLTARLRAEQDARLTISTQRLAGVLTTPVHDYNRLQIIALMRDELQQRDVRAIVVRDALDSSILAAQEKTSDNRMDGVSSVNRLSGFQFKSSPIQRYGETLGTVQLFYDNRYMDEEIQASLRDGLLMLLILLIALVIVISASVTVLVLRPLAQLEKTMQTVTGDRLEHPIETSRNDEIGGLARAFSSMRDSIRAKIGELQRSEANVRESEERLRGVVSSMPVMLNAFDTAGNIVAWNGECERVTGYSTQEIVGNPEAMAWLYPNEEYRREVYAAIKERANDIRSLEFTLTCKNGEGRTIAWSNVSSATPIKGWANWAIGVDVTERLRMEEQLRQSYKLDAIGQLAGGVAHDFNNQLTGILGYAELLEGRLSDPQLRQFAAQIRTAAARSADLTSQLLAFSRKGVHRRQPVDIHQLIAEAIALLERSIDPRIVIRQQLQADEHVVPGDPSLLQSALLNIGINARDAMPNGGSLTFATTVSALDESNCRQRGLSLPPGRYLEIDVSDTGSGIPPEARSRIFEPFFTTKEEGKGTGMGLPAVYGTVQTHGGAIDFVTEVGHGTTFRLYLPLTTTEKLQPPPAGAALPAQRSATVLLVDDDPAAREVCRDLLRSLGHEVIVCSDGAEAIGRYRMRWQQIDLVLLDMIMPKMNGRDVFSALKETNPNVRVLLSSGFSLNEDSKAILDAGVSGYIQKPYARTALAEAMAKVLPT